MSKKIIRIAYFWLNEYEKGGVRNILQNEFEIIEDNENPDYLIFGYEICINEKVYREAMQLLFKYKNAITIFYTTESILPNFNLFDYIFGRDDISFGDRYIRILYNLSFNDNSTKGKTLEEAKALLQKKKYFCNFIYSHGNGHIMRDIMFDKLSEYKFVHALGKHKKNCNIEIVPRDGDWYMSAIEAKSNFKFSISAENCLYPDGTTEKIYTSFLANTIPIYFGDVNVGKYFNKEAFINYHDYNNIDELVKRVIEVDNNDELWCSMIMKPYRTEEQLKYLEEELKKNNELFLNIFRQDIENAHRKPSGLMVDFNYNVINNTARMAYKSEKHVNKIVWFIPVKKWRNKIRKIFL